MTRKQSAARTNSTGRRIVRRPTRGLEIKDDRPAVIKVIQANNQEIPLVDAGAPSGTGRNTTGYANFLLQNVTEARMEKHQIVETFGESYIFFFGESPRFIDVQMVVINSHDFNWKAEWWENYDKYFRGTKLVEMGARMYLFYDDNIVEGYMLNSQAVETSDQPFMVQMSFRMFVTSHRNISFVGDPLFPIRASIRLPKGVELQDLTQVGGGEKLFDAYRQASLDKRKSDAFAAEVDRVNAEEDARRGAAGRAFDANKRLTRLMQTMPRTLALPPNIYESLQNSPNKRSLVDMVGGTRALRTKIAENLDEYLGAVDKSGRPVDYTPGYMDLPDAQVPRIKSQQEVEDLWLETVRALREQGVDIGDPDDFTGLGLMAKASASISLSASVSASVSASASASASAQATFRASAGVAARASTGFGTTEPVRQRRTQRDPLGAVFGAGVGASASASAGASASASAAAGYEISTRKTVQGGGDKEYGYHSAYAGGRPGFGEPGYGDLGGEGHGSGQGEGGDPGFRDPALFSYKGVAEASASFSLFNRPKTSATAYGNPSTRSSLGAGTAGSSGGGSMKIEGTPSSFAMIAVEGTLFGESVEYYESV